MKVVCPGSSEKKRRGLKVTATRRSTAYDACQLHDPPSEVSRAVDRRCVAEASAWQRKLEDVTAGRRRHIREVYVWT
jgi:hypothetical protein